MSTLSVKPHSHHIDLPAVHRVPTARPFAWLRAGWDDFRRNWPVSLAYGVLFSVLGYLLVDQAWSRPHLAMALTTGFLLFAPFLAIGFYDISRRGERPGLLRPFASVRRNATSIGMFALLLAFILSAWERLSAIMVGLFFRNDIVTDGGFYLGLLFTPEHIGFVVPYVMFGGILALGVFALSVVSLPMLMDRRVDFVTAIMTSLWVVRENPLPMLVWAVLIGALAFLGQLAWFIPLAVIFPILGHATWHAYRDLVEPSARDTD
ncbi:MAG: DUF2189 domain-containing protein [Thiobacillaceae bacterium]|jgi:uncharacterized membrane protein|nr:DUF2189 domain-containing protein [Thiobacillaceae bacterium]